MQVRTLEVGVICKVESVNPSWGVAPRLKHYYCEYCKEDVFPIDADEKFELAVTFGGHPKVVEVVVATHKKCGHILKETFWGKDVK